MVSFSKYLTFVLFLIFFFKVSVLAEENLSKPTAIFTAVFWEKYKSAQLIYTPWGNGNEVNATTRNLRVGFSSPSKEFAYYGDDNVAFYPVNIDGEEKGVELEMEKVAEFSFTPKKDTIQRYLLLFLTVNSTSGLKYKIHGIPFSESEIPFGSLKFFSQFPEALYLSLNKKTMTLPSGGSKTLSINPQEETRFYPLECYVRKEGKYEKVLSQSISLSNDRRGFLFFAPVRERLRIKPYLVFRQPLTHAIGYGVPSIVEPKVKPKDDTNPKNPLSPENTKQLLQPIVQ
ncbi:MAG: hypothetical protein VX130_03280 [Verrucomicrobiota bacterium]|nr:hypothetical protein [Verrucomicrobiota bacterium]